MRALLVEDDIKVSTHEIDFAGHVSNIVYLRWLEDMRLKMFDSFCPLQDFMENGVTPILVSTEIQYKKSIRLFDKPHMKMWLADLGLIRLTIEAEIFLDGELTTSARHVGVFVDIAKMKPVRIPGLFKEAVAKYTAMAERL